MKLQGIIKGYPVALGSTIALVVFLGLGFWRASQVEDMKNVLVDREQESERLSSNVHNAAKLNAQLGQLADVTQKAQGRLSNPTDLATNQQYFYKIESDSGVKLIDLHQGGASKGSAKKRSAFYSTIPYSLRIQGDYLHALKFIRSIENGSRFAVIDTASFDLAAAVRKDDEVNDGTLLSLSLNLQLLGTP